MLEMMRFEWDEKKNVANLHKHSVPFELAEEVFDDPLAVSCKDRHEKGEERWQTIDMVGRVILLVAHTYCAGEEEEVIRIISARKATKQERDVYEAGR